MLMGVLRDNIAAMLHALYTLDYRGISLRRVAGERQRNCGQLSATGLGTD